MKRQAEDTDDRKKRWKFGQNFLIDEGIIRAIADDVPCSPSDWVVEIGPGQGALTRRLATRCAKLTALEIDPKWVEHLGKHPEWGNLEVLRADAARVDLDELLGHAPRPGLKPVVVGNLPYNRAAPILFHFVPRIVAFQSINVMVQYEVAKRICAKPHTRDFGFLTVFIQNYCEAELLRKIPQEAFRPRPKVLSATLRLTPRPAPFTQDPLFLRFVEAAFSRKRKMLHNSLQPGYVKLKVTAALEAQGINPNSRAEDLSVEQFVELYKTLGEPLVPGTKGVKGHQTPAPPSDVEESED